VYAAAVAVLAAAWLLASWVPARRVKQVEINEVLRD